MTPSTRWRNTRKTNMTFDKILNSKPTDTFELGWPDIFSDESLIKGLNPASLCAAGLIAWSNVMMGNGGKPIPESFGRVLVALAEEIGMKKGATADNLTEFAREKGWLKTNG